MMDSKLKKELENYINQKEIEVLGKVYKRIEFEDYFFRTKSDLKWFYPLKILDYFRPENVPSPIPTGQEGFFKTPDEWNVLLYLERVSQQVNLPNNGKYINELITIIKGVSNYLHAKGQHVYNSRTWWYFVKILLNITNEKIPNEIIDLIPIWLDSKFDTGLQGAEIATKLLPKFLPDNPTIEDIEKAEKIIHYLTTLKPIPSDKEKSKSTLGREKYRLAIEPYRLTEAFKKYSIMIGEKCSNKVVDDLSVKIKDLLKKEESTIPLDFENKTYLMTLSEESDKYIVRILVSGEKPQSEIIKEILTEQKSNGVMIKELSIDICGMVDFVNKVYGELAKEALFKNIEIKFLKRKIYNLHRNLHDRETYKSLYEESKYRPSEPPEVLTFILKRILMAKAKKDTEAIKAILRRFIEDKYLYFPKMALYIIANNIESYSDIFWESLDRNTNDIILEDLSFGDELRHLLRNLKNLSNEQKRKLENKIEQGPVHITKENADIYIARWKQKRYQALASDLYFKKLYDNLKKITGKDVELSPAVGEIKSRWGEGPSPLTKEQIFQMPNKELVEYLAIFKTKDFWNGPTVGGLANALKDAVTEQPEKFVSELSLFLECPYFYVYKILSGVEDAWNKKKLIDWNRLFDFISRYIGRPEFWRDKFTISDDDWKANHEWIVGIIAKLIQDGTREDSWSFPEEHFKKVEKIIFLILENLKNEGETEITDYVTYTLNTLYGKTLTALIYLVLRVARICDKKGFVKNIKWEPEIKEKYNQFLDRKVIEAFACLGQYLPNLYYLDKEWVKGKIECLDNEKGSKYWEAFMVGYLSGGKVYNDLYNLLRSHYHHGIGYHFKEKHNKDLLVQHISLGYLRGFEDIDKPKSLFNQILSIWNRDQIKEIIDFFWMSRDYVFEQSETGKNMRGEIVKFWRWLYEKYKEENSFNEDDKIILSDVIKLTLYLPQVDKENIEWLILSAPYVHVCFNSPFFIEYLDELKDRSNKVESAKYIGDIFLKILEMVTPDFDQKHIRSIVEFLYKSNARDSAREICNKYTERGLIFLRDIYEKYSSK